MLNTYKIYKIYDFHDKKQVTVKLFITDHASYRFNERSKNKEEDKIMLIIEKALYKIINDYPFEDSEFIIKSNSLGIKIPMVSKIDGKDLLVKIPTILSIKMKTSYGVPNLTIENIKYSMFTEIII